MKAAAASHGQMLFKSSMVNVRQMAQASAPRQIPKMRSPTPRRSRSATVAIGEVAPRLPSRVVHVPAGTPVRVGSGQHLLVEGSSDFIYLQRLTEYCLQTEAVDSDGLDPRLAILPVGGIDNMPAFVALLGRRLAVSALVDGDRTSAKLARIKRAAEHNDVSESAIVVCSDVTGLPTNADIEDLFDVNDYVKLYNWAFETNLKVSDLPATSEPILKKISSVRGEFDHALPAHALTQHRKEFFAALRPKTTKQFVEMFHKLNGTLAANRPAD